MKDLTRWNRAGLKRFRYIDGNAITHLELLRAKIAEKFDDGSGQPRWTALSERFEIKPGETPDQRDTRMIAQYEDARRDYGWEILRSFARSSHVLSEHMDAYANETFIGTATQWDSVKRLIALLDARPAPGASARGDLAIEAKAAGTLAAGFQVKNEPADGAPPAIFETQEDLALDPALNAVKPKDWNKNQTIFDYNGTGGPLPLGDAAELPSKGSIAALLIDNGTAQSFGVRIENSAGDGLTLQGEAPATGTVSAQYWQIRLLSHAKNIATPRLAGDDVVILSDGHNLTAGRSSVTWNSGGWKIAKVTAVDGDRVQLEGDEMPAADTELFNVIRAVETTVKDLGLATVLPFERDAGGTVWSSSFTKLTSIKEKCAKDEAGNDFVLFNYVTGHAIAWYTPIHKEPVATVITAAPNDLVLPGKVDGIASGDIIVAADSDQIEALLVDSIEEQDGDTLIKTVPAAADLKRPVHYDFKHEQRPKDHDRNFTAILDETLRSDVTTTLAVDTTDWHDDTGTLNWPEQLKIGRSVIVQDDHRAHFATVQAIDQVAGTVDISPPIPGTELTEPLDEPPMLRWNSEILANVAAVDHGETQNLKILGSGDATKNNQAFEAEANELSFTADPLMPQGVAAAIEVFVESRQWQQVANLRSSKSTDHHFEVRIQENGKALVHFGDGKHGRRLPTGTDNVRIIWRKGMGESGNLAPGSLAKIAKPNPLVKAVQQPIATSGGAGKQPVDAMREQSAQGLLTLGRAVSLHDFAKLAAENASVLQAHAQRLPRVGRFEQVEVIIVPAGGRMGTLGDDIQHYLASRSVPGVGVQVRGYEALPLSADVLVRVDTEAFVPDDVVAAVEAALIEAFDFSQTKLGASLYRSQLLHLIEQVVGVENVTASIRATGWSHVAAAPYLAKSQSGEIRAVHPNANQMIHIDADYSVLTINWEAFAL